MSCFLQKKVSISVTKMDIYDNNSKTLHAKTLSRMPYELANLICQNSSGQLEVFLSYSSDEYSDFSIPISSTSQTSAIENMTILKYVGKELYIHFQNFNILSLSTLSSTNGNHINKIRIWITDHAISSLHCCSMPPLENTIYVGDLKYSDSYSNLTDTFAFGFVACCNSDDFFIGFSDYNRIPFSSSSSTYYLASFTAENFQNPAETVKVMTYSQSYSKSVTRFENENIKLNSLMFPTNSSSIKFFENALLNTVSFENYCIKLEKAPVFNLDKSITAYRYKNIILAAGGMLKNYNLYNIGNRNYYYMENNFAFLC